MGCVEVLTLLHDLDLNRMKNVSMFGSKSQKLNQPLVVPDCHLSVIAILDHNSWIGNPQSEPWWHQQVSLSLEMNTQTYAHSLNLLQEIL